MKAKIIAVFYLLFIFQIFSQENNDGNLDEKYTYAESLYLQKEYQASLIIINKYLLGGILPHKFRILAAANYLRLNETPKAIEQLGICIQEHPDNIESILFLSHIYLEINKTKSARKIARTAIKKFGYVSELYLLLAKSYYKEKEYTSARKNINLIFDNESNNQQAYFIDGLIFFQQKRYGMAEFRFRHALNLKNTDNILQADILNNLGVVIEKKNRILDQGNINSNKDVQETLEEAKKFYLDAIKKNPDNIFAKNNLNRVTAQIN